MSTAEEHLARLARLREIRDESTLMLSRTDEIIAREVRAASAEGLSVRAMARATGWSSSWLHAHYLARRASGADGSLPNHTTVV